MRTKKLKQVYDETKGFKIVNDVLIKSTIERLKKDEELDRDKRVELADELSEMLKLNERLGEIENDYFQNKQFDAGWFTGLGGSLLGIALVEYGPKIVKLFKKK